MCETNITIILFEITVHQNSLSFKQIVLKKTKKILLGEGPNKHASNRPITFVTPERFAVVFFLPSCCINSLLFMQLFS